MRIWMSKGQSDHEDGSGMMKGWVENLDEEGTG
jgi:hypothetical protein